MSRCLRTFLMLIVLAGLLEHAYAGNVELHFIQVGQGDCTLIKTQDGRKILVDCGSTGGGDVEEVREYLLGQLGPDPSLDVVTCGMSFSGSSTTSPPGSTAFGHTRRSAARLQRDLPSA